MIRIDSVPEATAPAEHHADFLELCTLRSRTRSISIQEFIRDLRIGNATEVISDSEDRDEDYEGDNVDESVAQSAFDELDERRRNFGPRDISYPFILTETTMSLKENGDQSLYTFLALLSWCGKDAGPKGTDGEKIFEGICAKAAEGYLGRHDDGRVRSVVFGFPRRILPVGFSAALDELCKQLGEGSSHRKGRPKLPDQKDGKLDVVAWVEFHDRRPGKLITFGQCATGRNWHEKISELPPTDIWCTYWMADAPSVHPVRSFFVPHRVERDDWLIKSAYGGILYDRCRIASLATNIDNDLRIQWVKWSSHVLHNLRAMA